MSEKTVAIKRQIIRIAGVFSAALVLLSAVLCAVGLFLLLPNKLKTGFKPAHSMRSQANCFWTLWDRVYTFQNSFLPQNLPIPCRNDTAHRRGCTFGGVFSQIRPSRSREKPTQWHQQYITPEYRQLLTGKAVEHNWKEFILNDYVSNH